MNKKRKPDILLQEAYDLVKLKWELIIKELESNNEESIDYIYDDICHRDEFNKLINCCAYCHLYFNDHNDFECEGCPLVIDNDYDEKIGCISVGHPFDEFMCALDSNDLEMALLEAKDLLELIEETKPQT
jgi:hypothetical protein